MKSRRCMPSFFARSSESSLIRCSTCFCFSVCGRGSNSSFETTCVGIGESTPFFLSRIALRIHIMMTPWGNARCATFRRKASANDTFRLKAAHRTQCLFVRSALRLSLRAQVLAVNRVIEPADHHLFPGLRHPAHFLSRVGVVSVAGGIVVMRQAFEPAVFRRGDRLFQPVIELPVEVVLRHAQQ